MATVIPASSSPPAADAPPANSAPAGEMGVPPSPDFDAKVRRSIHWVALLAVTVVVFYVAWLLLAPFFDVLMWAVVPVICFRPVYRRLELRLRSPNAAAALSCLLVIVMILVPVTLILLAVARDAARVAQYLQVRDAAQWLDPNSQTPVARILRRADQYVDVDRFASQQYLADRLRQFSGSIARGTLNLVGGLVGAVVEVFLIVFAMFFLFRDGPQLWGILRDAAPLDRWQLRAIVSRTKDVIWASVYGSVAVAIVQGVLGGVGLWALGVPSPLLWGAVMTILCMIPLAGSFLVWFPAAIYLLITGHPWKAIVLAVWGTLVISTIDNILRPLLVGKRIRMHELVVFFSVIGGLNVFGPLGIVMGPVIAALALALLDVWRQSACDVAGDRVSRPQEAPRPETAPT